MSYATWFSALGAPLDDEARAAVQAYLAGLGLRSGMPIHTVTRWEEAGQLIRAPSCEWWEREEAERARLERSVQLDPAEGAWVALNDALHVAAEAAAARLRCADAGLIKAATGAASYAVHHFELAVRAGAPAGHPFRSKHALFAGGHWPLGVYGGRFAIF